MQKTYQICKKCVMDTSDEDIHFDIDGVCNYCHNNKLREQRTNAIVLSKEQQLSNVIAEIKKSGTNKQYDCIIGLSGGVDSSYVAYIIKKMGLRPLAIHVDNGWNSELAVKNIENIVKKLDIDLYTYVVDWEEFKSIQRAYFKASVVDIEVVTDNAIFVILNRMTQKYKVKYFLSGFNATTEGIMPASWFYSDKMDSANIKDIYSKFGEGLKLKTFPLFSFLEYWKWKFKIDYVKEVSILNLINYDKENAKELLKKELGWQDYGTKHGESVFTKFYQNYILPQKFSIDKRRAFFTSLIWAKQILREEALKQLESPTYTVQSLVEDKEYIMKKLSFSDSEFEEILKNKPKKHSDFKSYNKTYKDLVNLSKKLGLYTILKK